MLQRMKITNVNSINCAATGPDSRLCRNYRDHCQHHTRYLLMTMMHNLIVWTMSTLCSVPGFIVKNNSKIKNKCNCCANNKHTILFSTQTRVPHYCISPSCCPVCLTGKYQQSELEDSSLSSQSSPPSSFLWAVISILFLLHLVPSECYQISQIPLCGLCGTETFACGSNMFTEAYFSSSEPTTSLSSPSSLSQFSSSSSTAKSNAASAGSINLHFNSSKLSPLSSYVVSSNDGADTGLLLQTSPPPPPQPPSSFLHHHFLHQNSNRRRRRRSLNDKVQKVLLQLNRHLQVFNSSNCTCIPLNWRCDGEPDCPDSSDEIGCDKATCLPSSEFSCATKSKCIDKTLFCNGNNDCGDNSDEIDCTARECDIEHETRCDNGRCIPSEWLCDQFDDCGDLSDERCVNPCSPNEFQCHSGECIPSSSYCNNRTDCPDMSDEINCQKSFLLLTPSSLYPNGSAENSHISCPSSHFMCQNGLCISESYQCDGDNDCGDWSDEKGCDGRIKCRITEFLCKNGQCINSDWRCDGDFDCDDTSDEMNCPSQICSKEEFRCRSGRCIRSSWRCDGDRDCEDNSDEEVCAHRTECTSGNFRCRDGTCISLANVCNGAPNCPDGSDEDTNSTCIPNVVPCRENGFPCQHLCVATTNGHYCACKDGYRKGNDGRSCIDIDECQIGNLKSEHFEYNYDNHLKERLTVVNIQVCSQQCDNSVPGYQCSCTNGYRLRNDKRRCKAVQGIEPILLVSSIEDISGLILDSSLLSAAFIAQSNDLYSTDLADNVQLNLSPSQFKKHHLVSLDFLYSKNLVFWTNPESRQIYSALLELNPKSLILSSNSRQLPLLSRLKLTKVHAIIESGLVEPSGLAIDWVNSRVYWTDSGASRIEYSNLDGSTRKVLFGLFVEMPKSIVVNPEKSTVYWTDWGDPPRIESAFMDGSGRKIIVSSLLSMPSGLVIDYPASKLYWTDVKQNMIECSNLDGSSRYTIVHDYLLHPISLAIFEDNLYWTSLGLKHINTVSKLTGRNITTLNINDNLASHNSGLNFELKVFHSLRQPEVETNYCQSSPCSHLCLPNNVSYQCSCPFGFSFEQNNNHKCRTNSNPLLLFTHRSDIRAVTVVKNKFIPENDVLYNDYNLDYVLPIAHISFIVSLDYDLASSTIFWSDLFNKSIGRAKWTGKQQKTIVSSSLEAPSGIAYDWVAHNLYWTDTGRNVIEVAKSDGSCRSLVVWRSLDQPRYLVVDPANALMFWTQWTNQSANIERAAMDGSYRIILHSINLTRPHALALDAPNKIIYWTDPGRSQIEYSNYDGSNRRTFLSQNLRHPFALAIDGDFIYWSDRHQRNVQQAHKSNSDVRSILFEDVDSLMDIAILQYNSTPSKIQSQPPLQNLCSRSKCSHLCLLTPLQPGYRCACPTGIRLLLDGVTCADDMDKYLIITMRNAIKRISLETDYHFDVTVEINQKMSNALILDVHTKTNTVYWSDTTENVIYRANILTGKTQTVVSFGLLGANGLAVDNIGHKIYWTDAGRKRIEVANLDGSFRKVLINQDLDSPRAIAVNPQTGHMVWADWGSQVRIERADMDGKRRAILVSKDLGWPNGITIVKNGRIIWADSKRHTIEIVDLNGANRRRLAENLPSPYGVAVIDDFLYWTDWHSKSIYRILLSADNSNSDSQSHGKIELFVKTLSNLVDVRAINKLDSDIASASQHNMCQINNGGCSHLCLRNSALGYSCLCPTGMVLREDSKTCKSHISKQLLLACKTNLRRISLESKDWNDVYLPVNNLLDIVSIDYHFELGKIFYVDASLKEIRCLTLVNKNLSQIANTNLYVIKSIVSSNLAKPSSIVVDWIANNLYWSDEERHLIEVARLDGSSRKVLIDLDLDQPKCLAILPNFGLMFWINSGFNQRIEKAFLDGSGRSVLVNSDAGKLDGLAVDNGIDSADGRARLYWSDSVLQRIESIYLDGTNRQVVISKGLTLPSSVAVLGDHVYWTDLYNKVVERANRWTGEQYELISDNLNSIEQIKVMSDVKQNLMNLSVSANVSSIVSSYNQNPCGVYNGACSHLCLFRPHGYICACPSYAGSTPCSTVPGEIVSPVSGSSKTAELDPKYSQTAKKVLLAYSNISMPATDMTSTAQESPGNVHRIGENGDKFDESLKKLNHSLLEEFDDLCQETFNTSKCESSHFLFDDHIVHAVYAIALILLSLVVLICAILTFICKRKLLDEEAKLAKSENSTSNGVLVNNSNNNGNYISTTSAGVTNSSVDNNKAPSTINANNLMMMNNNNSDNALTMKLDYGNNNQYSNGNHPMMLNDFLPPPPPPPRGQHFPESECDMNFVEQSANMQPSGQYNHNYSGQILNSNNFPMQSIAQPGGNEMSIQTLSRNPSRSQSPYHNNNNNSGQNLNARYNYSYYGNNSNTNSNQNVNGNPQSSRSQANSRQSTPQRINHNQQQQLYQHYNSNSQLTNYNSYCPVNNTEVKNRCETDI